MIILYYAILCFSNFVDAGAKLCHSFLFSAGREPETASADQVMPGVLSPEQGASIILPGSLFERILIMNRVDVGTTFGFYNKTVLFPVGKGSAESESIEGRETRVGSPIASAIVGLNQAFQDLQDPVVNTFQIQMPPGMVRFIQHDELTVPIQKKTSKI